MAHVRRKLVDIHRAQGSAIANEAIWRIAKLYAVEKEARGSPPDHRVQIRQAKTKLVFDGLKNCLHAQLRGISVKTQLAGATRWRCRVGSSTSPQNARYTSVLVVARTDMAAALRVLAKAFVQVDFAGEPQWLPDSGNTSPATLPLRFQSAC